MINVTPKTNTTTKDTTQLVDNPQKNNYVNQLAKLRHSIMANNTQASVSYLSVFSMDQVKFA